MAEVATDATEKPKKAIVLIENDPAAVKAAAEIVASFAGYALHTFPNPLEFLKWIVTPAEKRGDAKLLIWSVELLGTETPASLRTKSIGVAPEVPLILTTFESPETSLKKWTASGAFNLIIKPVDSLLLKQNLRVALADKELDGENEVFQMQTHARIESLKPVPMTGFSEIGFVTQSDRAIPEGRPAKYYGDLFSYGEVRSLYARMFDQKQENGAWKARFTFYGPGRDQMLRIRTHFPKGPGNKENWIPKAASAPKVRVMIVADPSPAGSELSQALIRNFTNVEVVPHAAPPDAKSADTNFDVIFAHRNFIPEISKDDRFKNAKKIALTERLLGEVELRELTPSVIDIVFSPSDRVSLFKKLQALVPSLHPSEDRPIQSFDAKEILHVGQPVEITEISESSLIERYERAFDPGTVRKFILWYPAEKNTPILTGRCYKSEKDPANAGSFLNYFVFFGVSDHESKHIRLWIRDHYIMEKQGG